MKKFIELSRKIAEKKYVGMKYDEQSTEILRDMYCNILLEAETSKGYTVISYDVNVEYVAYYNGKRIEILENKEAENFVKTEGIELV